MLPPDVVSWPAETVATFMKLLGAYPTPVPRSIPRGVRSTLTALVQRSPLHGLAEHLHRDRARPTHICAGTGLTPPTSASGLGSPVPMALLSYPRRRRILAAALVPRGLTAGRALRIGGSEPWLSTGFDTAASLALLQPWISGTGRILRFAHVRAYFGHPLSTSGPVKSLRPGPVR
jgi:hypothetical protein